jgi:hypothetical protein
MIPEQPLVAGNGKDDPFMFGGSRLAFGPPVNRISGPIFA